MSSSDTKRPASVGTLRAMSDEDLTHQADHLFKTAEPGLGFYLDELARRERGRSARLALLVSLASLGVAFAALVVAVVAVLGRS